MKDNKGGGPVRIVLISAACCVPGVAAFDDQARRVVDQAVAEAGVEARVSTMPATTAFFGGAPREVMARLMRDMQSGTLRVPVVLIEGQAVSYGVPDLQQITSALREAAGAKTANR